MLIRLQLYLAVLLVITGHSSVGGQSIECPSIDLINSNLTLLQSDESQMSYDSIASVLIHFINQKDQCQSIQSYEDQIHFALGHFYYQVADNESAKKYLTPIVSDGKNLTPTQKADINYMLGFIAAEEDELLSALSYYNASAAYDDLHQDLVLKFKRNLNQGVILDEIGLYPRALEIYQVANALSVSLDILYYQVAILINKGVALHALSRYSEAQISYEKGLTLLEKEDYSDLRFQMLRNLSNVHYEKGEIKNALSYQEEAIRVARNDSLLDISGPLLNLAIFHRKSGSEGQAISYLKESIQIADHNQNVPVKANAQYEIGITYKELDSVSHSWSHTVQSLQSLRQAYKTTHPLMLLCYNQLASISKSQNELSTALAYIDSSITLNQYNSTVKSQSLKGISYLNSDYLFQSLIIKASIYKEMGNHTTEAQLLTEANEVLLQRRKSLNNNEDKITHAKNQKQLTGQVLDYAYRHKGPTDESKSIEWAFQQMELSKSNILLESITNRTVKNFLDIPVEVKKKEDELLAIIIYYKLQLDLEQDEDKKSKLQLQLARLNDEYITTIDLIRESYPRYYNYRYNYSIPSIEEIQSTLTNHTAILNYFTENDLVYILTITKFSADLQKITLEEAALSDLVTGFRKGITYGLDAIYAQHAHLLYKLLIPSQLSPQIEELLIIPEGPLSVLPYEALLTREVSAITRDIVPYYLISKYNLRYSPSLTLLQVIEKKHEDVSIQALLAVAPMYEASNSNNTYETPQMELSFPDQGFSALPASKLELQKIKHLFAERSYITHMLESSNATEEIFRSYNLSGYKYLHFATHGFVNNKNSDLSGLVLFADHSIHEDNILYVSEIYNLDFNLDLVTLSACETGLGQFAEGEGILGFARAFFHSGARNVILSEWQVNDVSTSHFMADFYGNVLNKGLSYAQALRQSKIAMAKSEAYHHPYYWAPFILTGVN